MLCVAEPGALTLIGPAWQQLAASCDLRPGDHVLLDCLPGQGAVRFQTCKPAMCAPLCCVVGTRGLGSCTAAWQARAPLRPGFQAVFEAVGEFSHCHSTYVMPRKHGGSA